MWDDRQRETLLEARSALERTSRSLQNSERVAVQTEQIGANVIGELGVQRETLLRAQGRLADVNSSLSSSRQLVNFMKRNVFMNKILLIFVIICEAAIIAILVYMKYFRHS